MDQEKPNPAETRDNDLHERAERFAPRDDEHKAPANVEGYQRPGAINRDENHPAPKEDPTQAAN